MSEPDPLYDAILDAIARRDLAAYKAARSAYGAVVDQLEAKVAALALEEAERGIAEMEEHLRLEALFESDPLAYWQHVAATLRAEREERMRRRDP